MCFMCMCLLQLFFNKKCFAHPKISYNYLLVLLPFKANVYYSTLITIDLSFLCFCKVNYLFFLLHKILEQCHKSTMLLKMYR